jgi:hypothetical protein
VSLSPIDHPVDCAHAHASDFLRIEIDAAQVNGTAAQIGSLASTDDGRPTSRRALRPAIHDSGEHR